jgi:hypothetical protein
MMNLAWAHARGWRVTSVRKPAVAGTFYPADPKALRDSVERLLHEAPARPSSAQAPPKAVIVPHAGYIYSGSIAAAAYSTIAPRARRLRRVVLLGPSHYRSFRGLALPGAAAFVTPLGDIRISRDAAHELRAFKQVHVLDEAHVHEHSLEVQLPFLQVLLPTFELVPLVVGDVLPEETAEVLERLWGGDETLIVVSSDLSHYHPYGAAVVIDRETTEAIERLDGRYLTGEQACGCYPIRGLLHLAKKRRLEVTTLDQRNSGDTAGDRSRVVGYGAWAFSEAA